MVGCVKDVPEGPGQQTAVFWAGEKERVDLGNRVPGTVQEFKSKEGNVFCLFLCP